MRFAHGSSLLPDTADAIAYAAQQARAGLGSDRADLILAFVSAEHVPRARELAPILHRELDGAPILGCSTAAPIAGAMELERGPAVAVLAASLPGVGCSIFTHDDLASTNTEEEAAVAWAQPMGITPDHRATILLIEPTTVPLLKLLPAFNAAVRFRGTSASEHAGTSAPAGASTGVLVGGLASAPSSPGGPIRGGANVLLVNDRVLHHGIVGLSLRGAIHADTIVSQGCRPFGPTLVVTKSKANLILELSGRPALEVLEEAAESLEDDERAQLRHGPMLGMVIDEYKPRFGRGDFLVRAVVGVDPNHKAIAVADFPKVGRTVRFHLRDARTAHEDLALLLDAQRLYDPPAGVLLVTCNGRGERFFQQRHHDARAVQQTFTPETPGEVAAKGGTAVDPARLAAVPLAGMHAAGEVGPVGGTSFLHGQTACATLFRPRQDEA